MTVTGAPSSGSPTSHDPPNSWNDRPRERSGTRDLTLRELASRVARRRWLLAAVAVTVFAIIALYTFTVTPRYKSGARLRIESQSASAMSALTDQVSAVPGAGLLGLGRDELETEVGVLRSDRVADAAIDSLALGVRVTTPASNRASVLAARIVNPAVDADGQLTLTRHGDGRYATEWKGRDAAPPLPALVVPNVPVQIGGAVIMLSPKLLGAGPSKIVVKFLPRYQVYKLLASRLVIARQEGGSRLVEVSYEDPDRVLAAQVVSTLIGAYVAYTTTTERTQDTTTVTQLQRQVDSTRVSLSRAETALRAFEERSRLIAPEEQATAQVKRIAAISLHVDAISTERNALARMLTIIEQKSHGGADASAYRQLATFPSLITNRAIQDLLQSLVDLENKRSTLGVRRTASNEEYRQLTNRITEIERQLYQIGPEYLQSLDQQLAMTSRTADALTDTLQEMPAAAMVYGRLVRDRTVLEATYVALQKQLKQAELKDVLRQQRVRIVDAPRIANPNDPSFPKKAVMLVLGAVLGVALALMVALAAELWREPA